MPTQPWPLLLDAGICVHKSVIISWLKLQPKAEVERFLARRKCGLVRLSGMNINASKDGDTNRATINNVDLHHLRSAVAAADCGSFRRAAELLSVRHSALSRSIKHFEQSIGMMLFERSSSGVRLTPAGRNVLRAARTILEQIDALMKTRTSSGGCEPEYLRVGFCISMSAGNLRATLLDFKRRFPAIELVTAERSKTGLTTALRNGSLDLLFLTGEVPLPGNHVWPLWSERVLISLPQDHPMAARDSIYWTDLRNEKVLLSQHDPGPELEDLLTSKLVCADRPRIERHDVSRGIIKSLISMGLGISLVMESETGATFPGLVYRELRDGTGASRIGLSAHWRPDNESPALLSLLTLLGERYPALNSRE
ncbi:DNA-binding transcriptional LysR family regulator [Bradyrhizobium sp. GM2.4]